jgi:hypothetical protein
MLNLLVIHQAELQLLITVTILLYSLLKASPADLLYSSAAPNPNPLPLSLRASAATNIHRYCIH